MAWEQCSSMVTLTWGLFALGLLLIAIAAFWNWFQVVDESVKVGNPERAVFYLFQPYALYYELVHRRSWPHFALVYGVFFLGCVCLFLGYLVGRQAGLLPP